MELTSENYYGEEANLSFFSASQVKAFKRCEASALAEIRGDYQRPMSQALLQGQFVDEALTGNYGEWVQQHPEICKRDGNLKAEFMTCQEMVSRARQDRVFMDFLSGEHQTILTAKLFGVPFKAKLDVIDWGLRIVDLKTVRDLSPVYLPGQGRVDFATAWDWPLQMAIYQKIVEIATGKRLPCYLAVITKESPPDIRIIHIEEERMEAELAWLEQVLPRYDAIKQGAIEPERCEKCAWCRQSRILTGPEQLGDFDESGGFVE
jgi:hypothetical protein